MRFRNFFGFILLVSLLFSLISCKDSKVKTNVSNQTVEEKENNQHKKETVNESNAIDTILNNMTIHEKVCQMFFTTPESITDVDVAIQAGESTKKALADYPVGGLIYFSDNIINPEQITEMISNSMSYSKIPLFIGVDEEGGSVVRISNNKSFNTQRLPSMESIGNTNDPVESFEVAKETGNLISKYGFNVCFSPVADIKSEYNNGLGDRTFGSDEKLVSKMVASYVDGLNSTGVCSVLKHFPGIGSSESDTHNGKSTLSKSRDSLESSDYIPFKAGMDSGADFVMISHVNVVNIDNTLPASLSKKIITDILKNQLDCKSIIITDSLSMKSIADNYPQACIYAIEAGADMLLIPKDIISSIKSIEDAISSGKIPEDRINESVKKILEKKLEKNIIK